MIEWYIQIQKSWQVSNCFLEGNIPLVCAGVVLEESDISISISI